MTKFEEDLKVYFPDIYKLNELAKEDAHIWELVNEILEMRVKENTGFIRVLYSKGHIVSLQKMVDILAFKKPDNLK